MCVLGRIPPFISVYMHMCFKRHVRVCMFVKVRVHACMYALV